jgi:acyl-CoA reductase-like NAD-dependent aldehyde dehydrogenase
MATATASLPSTTYRQLYIDGQWVEETGGKRLAVINPATEETIAEVAFRTREECKGQCHRPGRRVRLL